MSRSCLCNHYLPLGSWSNLATFISQCDKTDWHGLTRIDTHPAGELVLYCVQLSSDGDNLPCSVWFTMGWKIKQWGKEKCQIFSLRWQNWKDKRCEVWGVRWGWTNDKLTTHCGLWPVVIHRLVAAGPESDSRNVVSVLPDELELTTDWRTTLITGLFYVIYILWRWWDCLACTQ